jgi:hypothetical protein
MVDRRLLEHWQRERAARARIRNSLPQAWRVDSQPKLGDVCELYVEQMVELKRPAVRPVAIGDDDR